MGATPRRTSIFQEHFDIELIRPGLDKAFESLLQRASKDDAHAAELNDDAGSRIHHPHTARRVETRQAIATPTLTLEQTQSPLPVRNSSNMFRFGLFAFLLVAVVPLLQSTSFFGHASVLQPVSGSAIPERRDSVRSLERRADSSTDVCFRWAQQSALNNGTLYLYGGQATSSSTQDSNAWNNNFLSLDLTKTWQIASPALTGLPQPSGPPNVSLGYLWNSHDSLFLYGGQFSWKPAVSPTAYSTWEYAIADDKWIEHSQPVTSKGTSARSDGVAVQRAAEGAGANVPSLGRGFYFGGHLDGYTTEGWSQSVPRVYLRSLLEFTFPGATNKQVEALSNNVDAGPEGAYRNVTDGGQQADVGFTQRADGLLIYVPGFGDQGILLAVAGGTNESFTQMNQLDVYDIATSSWYIQSTSGPTPELRVNPCSVIAAAPDGTSYNIYMFGGQNLIPAGNQTQFNDMWILTLPSFTWIKVDMDEQSVPLGRSGHTCNVWDSQMVMVGGYVGAGTLTCERPGIYVFDLSALEWVNQFTAISAGAGDNAGKTTSMKTDGSGLTGSNNPFNQQPAQLHSTDSAGGLEGSYGYKVPKAVIDVIGGDENGGATLTTPVNTATAGPLATGRPITYTNAAGATVTSGSLSSSSNGSGTGGTSTPNIGAIIAGVVAGIFFIIACYLAFCAYVYRKQLQLYKRHVEMSQAQARGEKIAAIPGLLSATNAPSSNEGRSDPSRFGGASMKKFASNSEASGSGHSRQASGEALMPNGGGGAYTGVRRNSDVSDGEDEDLLNGQEPSFVGVMLNPRRSLRVINRD